MSANQFINKSIYQQINLSAYQFISISIYQHINLSANHLISIYLTRSEDEASSHVILAEQCCLELQVEVDTFPFKKLSKITSLDDEVLIAGSVQYLLLCGKVNWSLFNLPNAKSQPAAPFDLFATLQGSFLVPFSLNLALDPGCQILCFSGAELGCCCW